VEIPHLALGGAQTQLVRLLAAARAEGSAEVIVSCGSFVIELSFHRGRVLAETARDASKVRDDAALSLEDEAVLLILGWRRDEARGPFIREWHPDTSSEDVADDVLRTARHAYQCAPEALEVLLRVQESQAAATR
jgi:hypothetical protein